MNSPSFLLRLAITAVGDNNFFADLSGDLRSGGIFIATHRTLPIGTSVVMSVTLPKRSAPLILRGTVAWRRDPRALASEENIFGGAPTGVASGMGIRFDELDAAAARVIESFVQRRCPELFEAA